MLSIIIPTLNEEKIIKSTLSSLKAGLKIPHELIISDGGSKDRTIDIAKEYTDKIIVFSGQNRQTIAQGRNDGASIANGDFLVFFDADCSIPDSNQFFKLALSHFEKNKNLVSLTGYIRVLPEYETMSDRIIFGIMNSVARINNNIFHNGDASGGEFQMVRRDAFHSIKGYREDLVTREDRDLFKRLSKIGRTMSDPNLTVFHTGRRAHIVGWPRMIGLFLVNTAYFHISGKVRSKEWKVIR